MSTTEMISISEAAARLSVGPKTIRRMIAEGDLPARRIGKRLIRIDAADVANLGRELTVPKA